MLKTPFFKIVCGASFNDLIAIENLIYVFTLAGADIIDLAPRADVIQAANRGIERALSQQLIAKSQKLKIPILMASIQLDTDPHFRKVEVDFNTCDVCGACERVCPTDAFKTSEKELKLLNERCFGCGLCPEICHVNALKMVETKLSPIETLNEMILLGVKAVEFHFGKSSNVLERKILEMESLIEKLELVSFSIGSEMLSDIEVRKSAQICSKLVKKPLILQCDGKPMSGGVQNNKKSGNNIDKESIRVANLIQDLKLPAYLQISGGTDELSFKRARDLNVSVDGVAIGSYARKLLMPYISKENFIKEDVEKSLEIAQKLVDSVKLNVVEIK